MFAYKDFTHEAVPNLFQELKTSTSHAQRAHLESLLSQIQQKTETFEFCLNWLLFPNPQAIECQFYAAQTILWHARRTISLDMDSLEAIILSLRGCLPTLNAMIRRKVEQAISALIIYCYPKRNCFTTLIEGDPLEVRLIVEVITELDSRPSLTVDQVKLKHLISEKVNIIAHYCHDSLNNCKDHGQIHDILSMVNSLITFKTFAPFITDIVKDLLNLLMARGEVNFEEICFTLLTCFESSVFQENKQKILLFPSILCNLEKTLNHFISEDNLEELHPLSKVLRIFGEVSVEDLYKGCSSDGYSVGILHLLARLTFLEHSYSQEADISLFWIAFCEQHLQSELKSSEHHNQVKEIIVSFYFTFITELCSAKLDLSTEYLESLKPVLKSLSIFLGSNTFLKPVNGLEACSNKNQLSTILTVISSLAITIENLSILQNYIKQTININCPELIMPFLKQNAAPILECHELLLETAKYATMYLSDKKFSETSIDLLISIMDLRLDGMIQESINYFNELGPSAKIKFWSLLCQVVSRSADSVMLSQMLKLIEESINHHSGIEMIRLLVTNAKVDFSMIRKYILFICDPSISKNCVASMREKLIESWISIIETYSATNEEELFAIILPLLRVLIENSTSTFHQVIEISIEGFSLYRVEICLSLIEMLLSSNYYSDEDTWMAIMPSIYKGLVKSKSGDLIYNSGINAFRLRLASRLTALQTINDDYLRLIVKILALGICAENSSYSIILVDALLTSVKTTLSPAQIEVITPLLIEIGRTVPAEYFKRISAFTGVNVELAKKINTCQMPRKLASLLQQAL